MISTMDIYWIGGSPCSGKSTISEMLVEEFGLDLYKCDDYLDRYVEIGVKNNNQLMRKISKMTLDETWLRDVDEQVADEFAFYRIALETIKQDLLQNYQGKRVVVEGAAILPEFIQASEIRNSRYICMVPTKEFQMSEYRKREWVKHYLANCSQPDEAFSNWMERDSRYAQIVLQQAKSENRHFFLVDGTRSVMDTYKEVKTIFMPGE